MKVRSPQEHHKRPRTTPTRSFFGIRSDSSDDMFAFGGQVVTWYCSRHSFGDGHDPYHILSDDSIEQVMLDNVVDHSDYDFDKPIDLEYVACLGFDIYAYF
jgi:hypothetical protein